MAKSWGQRLDDLIARLGVENPIVLRPLKPPRPGDWATYRLRFGPKAYWIAMGGAFVLLALVILIGGR